MLQLQYLRGGDDMEKVVAPLHGAHVVHSRTTLRHAARDTERVCWNGAIGIYTSEKDVEKLDGFQWRNKLG